jgi:coproporphyrinogen III oxidase
MKEQFYTYIQNLQDQIIAGLEAVDGHAISGGSLGTSEGGGGRTRYRKWSCFEKAE